MYSNYMLNIIVEETTAILQMSRNGQHKNLFSMLLLIFYIVLHIFLDQLFWRKAA